MNNLRLHIWKWTLGFRRCPECRSRGYYRKAPRWADDKVAQMLGIAQYGCSTCGTGALKQRQTQLKGN